VPETYWARAFEKRLGRRRAITVTGATATAAAILAACGGGSSQSAGGAATKSGVATKPVDTTAQVRRGGTLKDRSRRPAYLAQVSPIAATGANTCLSTAPLSRKSAAHLSPSVNDLDPNIAESGAGADGLQITMSFARASNAQSLAR